MKRWSAVTALVVTAVPLNLPAIAQQSPQAPATRRSRSTTAATQEGSPSGLTRARSQAADLAAARASALVRLDHAMAAMQSALRALHTEEQRHGKGAASPSRLQALRSQAAVAQADVRTAQSRLAEITYQQSRLRSTLQQARTSAAPAPTEMARAPNSLAASQFYPGTGLVLDTMAGLMTRAELEERQATNDRMTAEGQVQLAAEALDNVRKRVDAGLAPVSEVTASETELLRARATLDTAQARLAQRHAERERLARLAALQSPVNVELRDASVRRAAQSISQASGLAVRVEDAVPNDKRLTVVAQGVPLATILDSIARQTDLLIAPYENGVALKPTPSLEVNGQRTQLMSPFAPWSSEWGMNPASSLGLLSDSHRRFPTAAAYSAFNQSQGGNGFGPTAPNTGTSSAVPETAASANVLVMGSVARPGGYAVRPTSRVSDVLKSAGGVDPRVATVKLVRRDESGKTVERVLDLRKIAADKDAAENEPLRPGDVLVLQVAPSAGESVVSPPIRFGEHANTTPFGTPSVGDRPGYYPLPEGPSVGRLYWQPVDGQRLPGLGGSVSITALSGDTFVLSHPAVGQQGEPAVMLTVYRLAGSQLRIVTTTLHRLVPEGSASGRQNLGDYRFRPGRSTEPVAPVPNPPLKQQPSGEKGPAR